MPKGKLIYKVLMVAMLGLLVTYYYRLTIQKGSSPVQYSQPDSAEGQVTVKPELTPLDTKRKYKYLILDYTRYQLNHTDFLTGNCLVSYNNSLVGVADAVGIATRKLRSMKDLPSVRQPWQRWVWILDESPYHAVDGQPFRLSSFDNVYNWTMTYRSDSDVYIPYGWVIRKEKPEMKIPDLGKRDGLIASVISNCGSFYVHNHRMEYVKQLNKTANVTLYGACGKVCSGFTYNQMHQPCPEIKKFKFYLAFENANCKEYVTEKLFTNALSMGAVPIVMGASREVYNKIAPPNSFIHAKDFTSPEKLGQYVLSLSENLAEYMKYHEWRKVYDVRFRIQFVQKDIWKPLCDKLNSAKGEKKTITSLTKLWTVSDCDGNKFW